MSKMKSAQRKRLGWTASVRSKNTGPGMVRRTAAITVATGTILGALVAAAPANAATGSTGHDVEQSRMIGDTKITSVHRAALARKDAAAAVSFKGATALQCPDGDCSWLSTGLVQQAQETAGYCGPATLSEMVSLRTSLSQRNAATALGYNGNGTDWSRRVNGVTRYPMADALDRYLGPYGANYEAVSLGGSISSGETADYKRRLQANTRNNWAIAGDVHERSGGERLAGHPNREIWHWIAIKGYGDWGNQTHYADSASGARSISWSGNVPRYSFIESGKLLRLMADRGYVW